MLIQISIKSQTNIDTLRFDKTLQEFDQNNSMIVIGESHGVAGTYELQNQIIKTFVKRGHSTIILEAGISEVTLLNEYLVTGNEEILEYTRASNKQYKELCFLSLLFHRPQ